MTITNLSAQSVTIRGRVTEPGLYIDPSNGLAVIAKDTFVAFYMSDVLSISGTDEKFNDWIVRFTAPSGEVKNGRMEEPIINRTFGYIKSKLIKRKI